jgi:hypothetical protein
MCMPKAPKIPDPVPPPAPPPAPTKTAKKVENKSLKSRQASKKRGTSALTVRRSTVNTGSSGSGANISY